MVFLQSETKRWTEYEKYSKIYIRNIRVGELKDEKWNETFVGFSDKITGWRKLSVWQSFKEITVKIDIGKTKEYYNSLSSDMLCDCDYCKLYYVKSRKEFSEW